MSLNRLQTHTGTTLDFTFNGKAYQGIAGDTLASALLANGVNVVGRSFKYCPPPRHLWPWRRRAQWHYSDLAQGPALCPILKPLR